MTEVFSQNYPVEKKLLYTIRDLQNLTLDKMGVQGGMIIGQNLTLEAVVLDPGLHSKNHLRAFENPDVWTPEPEQLNQSLFYRNERQATN